MPLGRNFTVSAAKQNIIFKLQRHPCQKPCYNIIYLLFYSIFLTYLIQNITKRFLTQDIKILGWYPVGPVLTQGEKVSL